MVNVQRQAPVAPARDETALDIFRHQWELYRKFLTHDYLENAGAYAELHRFLNDNVARPFAFVNYRVPRHRGRGLSDVRDNADAREHFRLELPIRIVDRRRVHGDLVSA